MSLLEKIEHDMKQAMVARDAVRLGALRMLKSALKYAAIAKTGAALSDGEATQVLQKQIKQRRESIEQFRKGGRADLAGAEEKELAVLEVYLPKQMGDDELERFVETQVREAQASSKKDFGRLMKLCTEKLAGAADNKRLSEILGKLLP